MAQYQTSLPEHARLLESARHRVYSAIPPQGTTTINDVFDDVRREAGSRRSIRPVGTGAREKSSFSIKGQGWVEFEPELSSQRSTSHPASFFRRLVLFMFLSAFAFAFLPLLSGDAVRSAPQLSIRTDNQSTAFTALPISRLWSAYTPYYSVEPYTPPPRDCEITQVNIIQRHGARYPTSGASTRIIQAVAKLQSATEYKDERLAFLANYVYDLGVADLVPFGAHQSSQSGSEAFYRYKSLVSKRRLPFVRTSSGQRVVDSATNWTTGFSLASDFKYNPPISVVLSESANDTLDDNMCPNVGNSDTQTSIWASIFGAPIADRLNSQAVGANLTPMDISNLMPLCAFDTVYKERLSPFCALFTQEEFEQYEYFGDLDKFYGTGYGQELGPVQGVGYVNELLARLTHQPVHDHTQTNRTLDSSPLTFPLDRTIYADFSHDNQMIAIYAAMGLFKQKEFLDPRKMPVGSIEDKGRWVTSRLTPFSGRLVTEKLVCSVSASTGERSLSSVVSAKMSRSWKKKSFVRVFVNDALQPLEFCGGDKDGLCELYRFVESQEYARHHGQGDFQKCLWENGRREH